MESNTQSMNRLVVSDLFQQTYDHAHRLAEQEILYTRLMQYPDDKVLMDIAKVLKDMTDHKIASIVHQEWIIEKLQRYGKLEKIEIV